MSEGYTDEYKPSGPEDRETMLKSGVWVRVYDIPGILRNVDALSAILFFRRWQKMGLPYGPWGMNPNVLVEIVDLLEPLDRFYHPPLII